MKINNHSKQWIQHKDPELNGTNKEPSGRRSGISTLPGDQSASGASVPAPLAIVIRRAGMLYHEFWRQGDVAIYSARKGDWIEHEICEVQILAAGEFACKLYPPREAFPSSSAWGQSGWTFTNNSHHDPLAAALAKSQTLLKTVLRPRYQRPR
jgi:hypothetical protein